MNQGVQTGVAEWEEPRHSGRLVVPPYPTISHFATRFPTFPSDGRRPTSRECANFGSSKRHLAGGEEWVEGPLRPPVYRQERDLGAILRADRPLGGFLAVRRNPHPAALLLVA